MHLDVTYESVKERSYDITYCRGKRLLRAEYPDTPPEDDEDGDGPTYSGGGGSQGTSSGGSGSRGTPNGQFKVKDTCTRQLRKGFNQVLAEDGQVRSDRGTRKGDRASIPNIKSRRKKEQPHTYWVSLVWVSQQSRKDLASENCSAKSISCTFSETRIVTLDLASLVAGTKYRGQFEERMKAVMNELEKSPDVILYSLTKFTLWLEREELLDQWTHQICSSRHWQEESYNVLGPQR